MHGKEQKKKTQFVDDKPLILDDSPNSLFIAFDTFIFSQISRLKVNSSKTKSI